jgi:hypothetical protein
LKNLIWVRGRASTKLASFFFFFFVFDYFGVWFEKGCVLESWGFDSNLISFWGFLIFSLSLFLVLYRYFGVGFR